MTVTGRWPARRPELQGAIVAFAMILTVLMFETGLHSVHHLDDGSAQVTCVVASVASRLAGATDVAIPESVALASGERLVAEPRLAEVVRPPAPRAGRSPPSLA